MRGWRNAQKPNDRVVRYFLMLGALVCFIYSGLALPAEKRPVEKLSAEKEYRLNIPTQNLADALSELHQQTGVISLFPFDLVEGKTSNPVVGEFTLQQGLSRMLKDTGLTGDLSNKQVISISLTADVSPTNIEEEEMNLKQLRKNSIAGAVAASVIGASPAISQAQEETSLRLEEITVTARRVQESLQDTPIAVTVTSGEELINGDISRITGITETAPNVNFSFGGTSSGSDSAAVVFIRGVGQNDFTVVSDPGVGIYVDGVFLGRTVGSALDIFDLQQVEVLRGPQGTVFGRNSVGGAINVITAPVTDDFEGRVRAVAGDDGRFEQNFTLNIPITDTFGIRGSVFNRDRDGTVIRNDGTELGDDNITGGRFKAHWKPSDNFRSTFSVDFSDEEEESAAETLLDSVDGALFFNFFNGNTFGNGSIDPNCAINPLDTSNPNCANDQSVQGPFSSAETGASFNESQVFGASLTTEWDITENLTLKNITGFRDIDAIFARSSDGTPFDIFETQTTYEQEQLSVEYQLIGTGDKFNWVAGLFYFEEEASGFDQVTFLPPTSQLFIGADTDNSNVAVFGEATWDVTDRLRLLGGVRYTDESKETDLTSISLTLPIDQLAGPAADVIEQDFEETTWRASAIYSFNDNLNGYVTASTGFKSGGVFQRVTGAGSTVADLTFEPEFVDLVEIGLKGEYPEAGLRFGLSVFQSDYTDIQLDGAPPGAFATIQFNAGDADINGVEFEFDWAPTDALLLRGALGLIDAEYTNILESANTVTAEDDLIRTPDVTWSLIASYEFDLGSAGLFTPSISWVYNSETAFEAQNTDLTTEDGFNAFDLNLRYDHPSIPLNVTLGIDNLTDEEYLVAADFNGVIGYELGVFARQRNAFIRVDYEF